MDGCWRWNGRFLRVVVVRRRVVVVEVQVAAAVVDEDTIEVTVPRKAVMEGGGTVAQDEVAMEVAVAVVEAEDGVEGKAFYAGKAY